MALVDCPDCGAGVSEAVEACPYCGRRMREPPPVAAQVPAAGRRWGWQWRSKAEILGWPLVHIAVGRDSATGRLLVAKGIIAIGQFAVGVITVAQFGIGILFGLGQFVGGFAAVGQFALGLFFGLGQFATGLTAIGQIAAGGYVLAQVGWGAHVWSARLRDPEAVRHFTQLWHALRSLMGR